MHRTKSPAKSRSSLCCYRYKSACWVCCGFELCSDWLWCTCGYSVQWLALVHMWLQCAVIGSGAHVTVVAPVDNARGICKAFMKSFINSIIVVQTNLTSHTLEPNSSHVETFRSVWSWSAEIFEERTHTQIPCFYKEMISTAYCLLSTAHCCASL